MRRLLLWFWGRLRAETRTVVHRTPLKGLLACEACEGNPATVPVWSELEQREVLLCEWCFRRWKKLNRRMTVPKGGRRRGGGGGG